MKKKILVSILFSSLITLNLSYGSDKELIGLLFKFTNNQTSHRTSYQAVESAINNSSSLEETLQSLLPENYPLYSYCAIYKGLIDYQSNPYIKPAFKKDTSQITKLDKC